ncbi:MAG: isoleucine--tRNA ligase, partial [Alistipes sp.]|nr:isoleucine--tRNA ligase [Alistipes sp.]
RIFTDLNAVSGRHAECSVHIADFPKADEALIDADLEAMMGIAQQVTSMTLALRRKVSIKVRQPLQKIMIPVLDPAMARHIEAVKMLVENEVNVKDIELLHDTTGIITKHIKLNFKSFCTRYAKFSKQMAALLNDFTQEQIAAIESAAETTLELAGEQITVTPADFIITSEDMPGWQVASEGTLTVALDVTITPELKREGVARELVNRIQNIRKDADFSITDKIRVEIEPIEGVEDSLATWADFIGQQTLAVEVKAAAEPAGEVVVASDLDEMPLKIAVSRL